MDICGQLHAPAALLPLPIQQEAWWTPGCLESCGEKKFLALAGTGKPDHMAHYQRAVVHAPTKSVSAPAAILAVLIFHVIFMARQYTGTDRTELSGRPPTCRLVAGNPLDKYAGLVHRDVAHSSSMWPWRCFVASLENMGACSFVHLCNRSFVCSNVKLLDKMSTT